MDANWERTGIVGEDGRIDRTFATTGWAGVADVTVADGVLTFEPDPARWVVPDGDLFDRFLKLGSESDGSDVAVFAARYGALMLCEHDLPASHNPSPRRASSGPQYWCQATYAEPIATWHTLAAQARSVLNVAAMTRSGRPGRADDWLVIFLRSGRAAPWWRPSADVDTLVLADVVNEWLDLGDVRPRLSGRELRMVSSGGLFGTIALRLAGAVAAAPTVHLCDGCGAQISGRTRRPQSGRRAFCDDCVRDGVPARMRAQAARMRKRGTIA